MYENHLLEPVKCLLDNAQSALSEYQMIQQLESQGWLEAGSNSDNLALYGKHFLVYNALYQLKEDYRNNQQYLMISALSIEVIDCSSVSASKAVGSQTEMAELQSYYLDWSNLEEATQESVDQLLTQFWQLYVEDSDYLQSLETLGLEAGACYIDIKKQYRQLAMKSHPDKGGNSEDFQAIQHAFSLLHRRHRQAQ